MKEHNYVMIAGFIAMHLACLAAFFVSFNVTALVVFLTTFFIRTFALTGGYHRYFAHKSFETSRAFQFILALVGSWAAQKGPLWWSGQHRYHHIHSDKATDIHSPKNGFLKSHVGWVFDTKNDVVDPKFTKDWLQFPELVWLDKYSQASFVIYLLILFTIGSSLGYFFPSLNTSGLAFVFWGGIVSTVLLYHTTFCVNSVCHIFGSRNFDTPDNSRNNLLIALLTFGEGWHNNHHKFAYSARNNIKFWQIDITYLILKTLSKLGIVWGFKHPKITTKKQKSD